MSDTLTELSRALAPKTGMRRIPFPLESYEHPSKPLSSRKMLNMLIEQAPAGSRTEAVAVSSPGLVAQSSTYTGPIKAVCADLPGLLYLVSGTHLWRLSGLGGGGHGFNTAEDLGDIGSPSGTDYAQNLMYTIAVGVNAAVVCVPPNAFTCGHTVGDALNQITGTFPGARSVAYLDGYFVFTSDDMDAQFFTSLLLDPTLYATLDFAFADGVPNLLRRVVTHRGDLWLYGDAGIEPWYNSGDADFPFRKRGPVIPHGADSIKTIAFADGSLFWVGQSGIVFRSDGYQAVRVSTHAEEAIIKAAGVELAVCAYGYSEVGHTYYCVTYGARTLSYDCATKKWADLSSSTDGSLASRISCAARAGNLNLLGDSLTARFFVPDATLGTEDSVAVIRQIVMPPIYAGTNLAYMNRVEIEMDLISESVTLDWSDDGGVTYRTPARTLALTTSRSDRKRYYTTRLGSFRQRVLRITVHEYATIYAVDADITGPPNTSGG